MQLLCWLAVHAQALVCNACRMRLSRGQEACRTCNYVLHQTDDGACSRCAAGLVAQQPLRSAVLSDRSVSRGGGGGGVWGAREDE